MENKKFLFIILLFLSTMWYSCNKTEDGSYVAPITVYEKVDGTWKLLSIKMIDETAKSANIKPDEVDLTDQFTFQTFSITLNVDAENKPGAYSVTGTAPALLEPNGFWDLDNAFPRTDGTAVKINLYSDAAKTQKTNQVSISTMPGAKAEMELKLTHISNKVAFITYQYKLVLANK
jgi:hypothetical protein